MKRVASLTVRFTRFFGKPAEYDASALAARIAKGGAKLALPGTPAY